MAYAGRAVCQIAKPQQRPSHNSFSKSNLFQYSTFAYTFYLKLMNPFFFKQHNKYFKNTLSWYYTLQTHFSCFYIQSDLGTLKAFNSNDNAKLQVGVNIMLFSRRNLSLCPNSEAFTLRPSCETSMRSFPPALYNTTWKIPYNAYNASSRQAVKIPSQDVS